MARYTDTIPPQVPQHSVKSQCIEQTRLYEVITPLLGGGSKVQHPDSQTVVRASQIRGLLRYWWRATRGGLFHTVKELKAAEALVWGGQSNGVMSASRIAIDIESASNGDRVYEDGDLIRTNDKVEIHDIASAFSYVLWPLRPQPNKVVAYDLRINVTFQIKLSYPQSIAADVEAALWAWETFGGVGSRTRRGLGALRLQSINGVKQRLLTPDELQEFVRSSAEKHVVDGQWPAGVPHLSNAQKIGVYSSPHHACAVTSVAKTPTEQWRRLVQRYRGYRQERYFRNVNGKNRPFGSSVWPDANAIRSAYRVDPHTQSPYRGSPHVARAQMGLPIVMSFIPNKFEDNNSSRTTFMLDNEEGRHASPLIFRPVAVEGGAVGIVLILANSRIDYPVRLSTKEGKYAPKEQFLDVTGTHDVLNHGDDQNNNQLPHGPTNTSDVLAGVFAYMKNA